MRDGISWLLNYLPPVKRYFLEMRFKPMPQYRDGALLAEGEGKTSPVGKMFIQPKVTLETGQVTLLDEVIGARFAIIAWGCNPRWGAHRRADCALARGRGAVHPGRAGSTDSLRSGQRARRYPRGRYAKPPENWFAQHDTAIAVVRPDRFVATVAIPQTLGKKLNALASKMQLASAQAPTVIEQVA